MNNPAVAGDVQFDTFIYGAPPLLYPAPLSQYTSASTPWPFANTNVPLNGHVCVPRGRGPFPLAVFAHGNHNPFENSKPGYLYLDGVEFHDTGLKLPTAATPAASKTRGKARKGKAKSKANELPLQADVLK